MSHRIKTLLAASMALLLTTSAPALAACTSGLCPVPVAGDVVSACESITFPTLSFPIYDPTSGNAVTANASSGSFHCTKEQSPAISFSVSGGQNATACTGSYSGYRAMKATLAGTNYFLCYQLYESNGGTAWPVNQSVSGSSLTPAEVPGGTGASLSIPIYGKIPAGQYVGTNGSTGLYTDSVVVTVSY